MSKATISMVMGTTGFGNASTLGSQPLSSPGSYFRALSLSTTTQQPSADVQNTHTAAAEYEWAALTQTKMPQFDMNLRDLFSDDELANRPTIDHPERQNFSNIPSRQAAAGASATSRLKTEQTTFSILSPQSTGGDASHHLQQHSSTALSHQIHTHQQTYSQTFADALPRSQQQPDFTFDDLSFLDSFDIAADQSNAWTGANDLFGTGGGGFDGNGAWEVNGGVDLFDGYVHRQKEISLVLWSLY